MEHSKPPEKHHDKKIDQALEDTFPASDPAPTSGRKTREERERRDAERKKSEGA